MKRKLHSQSGFTLIEVMIVVIIIGALAAFVGPELFGRVSQTRTTVAENQIKIFEVALNNYRLDNGSYPADLEALIEQPNDASDWAGPYIDANKIPKDPWGNEYHYRAEGENNKHKFDLWSEGRDNSPGGSGEDADVTNWE
ncbi:MAG: type II secretion system major pseudopilin GspG [Bacillota bacterium]